MSNPLFLTDTNESKVYDFGSTPYSPSTTHTETNITIPANANTVVTVNFLRASGKTFNNVTLNGGTDSGGNLTAIATFNTRRETGSGTLLIQAKVYDVSIFGALTCSQFSEIDSTSSGNAGVLVLLSEGFFQSGSNSAGFGDEYDFSVYNPNAANCSIANVIITDGQESASLTGVSSPLVSVVPHTAITALSASCVGSLSSNVFQEYAYGVDSGVAKRFQEILIIFSSQSDPFDGLTGKLTRPVVK